MEKTNKINLAEKVEAHEAKVAETKRQNAIEFVEKSAVPYLIDLANKGRRNTVITFPTDLYSSDIISALTERVECSAHRTGMGAKIYISW